MSAIAIRAEQDIKDMAAIMASYPPPRLWSAEQKKQAVQFAALLDTANKMIAAANIAGIDYNAERETFLNNAGKTGSKHTRRSYLKALERLEAYASRAHITPLELTPARADDFIYSIKGTAAANSIRRDIAACSSFFTWLERRHEGITNPFRGTKARPVGNTEKVLTIPRNNAEVKKIIAALPVYEAAAVSVMAFRGLRIGGIPGLEITGDRFKTTSKGKTLTGTLPQNVLSAIKAANFPNKRKPFSDDTPDALAHRIEYHIKKLYEAGKIGSAYSCHDFRHFFAITEYKKDKDIKRLQSLLFHAGIQITEKYLRSLNIKD